MLIMLQWSKGLLSRRIGRLAGAMSGVALAVALLGSLGSFIVSSDAAMTQSAVRNIPVDWQILLSRGADPGAIKSVIGKAVPYTAFSEVGYADVAGLHATTGGSTQTTGPGKVVGIPDDYYKLFPAELRILLGSINGVLVAQQTAANLHVTVGDHVAITRIGLPPTEVSIAGVVDLPFADSFFQAIGVPAGTAPQAPPDNVLLMPGSLWHQTFDPQANVRPDSVRIQLHMGISRNLPHDPNAAYMKVQQLANHVEAAIAGNGVVGNNLAARLSGVREDALYTRMLFLFLGLPGAIIAMLLTLAITASGSQRRRQEQALLRTRGASVSQIINLGIAEAFIIGIGGILLGTLLSYAASRSIASIHMEWNAATLLWMAIAAVVGLLLAVIAVVYPAWKETRQSTVNAVRAVIGRTRKPLWQRYYLDVILLAISTVSLWRVAGSGYQIVLAAEGVSKTSVNYEAFIAPICLWLGGSLLFMRLWFIALDRGRQLFSFLFRPIAKGLSPVVSNSFHRQRLPITRGLILVALSFSFAISTAVFNTTYNAQSRVDAELTNGSDITITGTTAAPPGNKLSEFRSIAGVSAIQPMQHRFAYVGNDLQDLYGIDPLRIEEATSMSNAFFGGGNAKAVLSSLANRSDGILLSEETITDYQLKIGDLVNLRLQNTADHQYHVIPFHLIGMVREFPTAPKDSFLVANAAYITQQTGSGAAEIVMIRSKGSPSNVEPQVQAIANTIPGSKVTDIGSVQRTISSSLTAVNLNGLTRLEIVFAILLAAGSSGLILSLGLTERRRMYAILSALGANQRQIGAFLWSEGLLILLGGVATGVGLGFGIAEMFVKVLQGVFDPPPEFLYIPWRYLILLLVSASLSIFLAVMLARKMSHHQITQTIRNL